MYQKTFQSRAASPIRFGTDGWRAVTGKEFTFSNVERVAQAYADFIKFGAKNSQDKQSPLIVVGYDRRLLSEQFAQRTAEVLAGNNFRTALFDKFVPTPLVSWAVREASAAGGVVITASHNPPEFNGFKIKADWGGSASEKITGKVELLIGNTLPKRAVNSSDNHSEITRRAEKSYREQIASFIDLERICASDLSVVTDAMHGAGAGWITSFLQKGKIKTKEIRTENDPFFGGVNPEPIDCNLAPLRTNVLTTRSIVGLVTDGDADRLGAVNELGETMTMHEVAPLLLLHLIRQRGLTGSIVTTVSQSVLTKRIAAAHNLPVHETPIGFKYIAEKMLAENVLIGAEESGGIGLQGHIPERDGILNALLLLEAIVTAGKPPSEIIREIRKEFGEFYFDRCDLKMEVGCGKDFVSRLADKPPAAIANENISSVETMDGTKLIFGDESWLLFRQSGTEPVLRVYAEATSKCKTAELLCAGTSLARKNLSN